MEVIEEFRGLIAEFKDSVKDLKNVVNDLKGLSCWKANAEEEEESKEKERIVSAIMEKIIGYMAVKELGVCRLVDKSTWLPIATKYLKRRGLIHLNGPDDENEDNPWSRVYRDLPRYCQEMPNFQTENLALGRGFIVTVHTAGLWKSFLQKFGAGIKYLRIEYHYTLETLQNLLAKYLPNLETFDLRVLPELHNDPNSSRLFPSGFQVPNLPRLKRIEIWNHGEYPRKVGKEFVDDLFSMGPNITSVKIVDRHDAKVTEYVLAAIQSRPKLMANINKLELDCVGSPTVQDLKIITKMKLKLLHLGVIYEYEMTSPEPLQSLLDSQCKTLEDLQLGNIRVKQPVKIQLPRFEMLSTLELTTDIPNGAIFGFSFGRLSYKETFPRLKHLSNCRSKTFYPHVHCLETPMTHLRISPHYGKKFFTGMNELWKEIFPQDGNPVQTLITLDIPYPNICTETTNNRFYYRLCEMFPNVNNDFLQRLRNGNIKIEPSKTKKKPKATTRKGPWSVYELLDCVWEDLLPNERSVLVDYGFINCKKLEEETNLFGVYIAIIKYCRCDLEELHQACIQGKLAEFIIGQYKSKGVKPSDTKYYAWFLRNKHIVKNPYPLPDL